MEKKKVFKVPEKYNADEIENISKKFHVSVQEIKKQLKSGVDVEHEHTSNNALAKQIALDHLRELPKYYTKLKKYVENKKIKEAVDPNANAGVRIKKHKNITFVFNGSKHLGNIHHPKDDDIGEHKTVSKHWGLKKNHPSPKDAMNWLMTVNNVQSTGLLGKITNSYIEKGKLVEGEVIPFGKRLDKTPPKKVEPTKVITFRSKDTKKNMEAKKRLKSLNAFREELEDVEKKDKQEQPNSGPVVKIKKTETGKEGNIIVVNPIIDRSQKDSPNLTFIRPEIKKTVS